MSLIASLSSHHVGEQPSIDDIPEQRNFDLYFGQAGYAETETGLRSIDPANSNIRGLGPNSLYGDCVYGVQKEDSYSNIANKLLDKGMERAAENDSVVGDAYRALIRTETESLFKETLEALLTKASEKSTQAQITPVENLLGLAEVLVDYQYPETPDYVLTSLAERQDYATRIDSIRLQTYISRRDMLAASAREQASLGNVSAADQLLESLQKIYFARHPDESGVFIFGQETRSAFASEAVAIKSLYADNVANNLKASLTDEIEALYKDARAAAMEGNSGVVDDRLAKIFQKIKTKHPEIRDRNIFTPEEIAAYLKQSLSLRRLAYDAQIQLTFEQILELKDDPGARKIIEKAVIGLNLVIGKVHPETLQPVFDETTQARYRSYVDQIRRTSRQQPPIEQVYAIAEGWATMGDIEATNAVLVSTAILYNATMPSTKTGGTTPVYVEAQKLYYFNENKRIRRLAYNTYIEQKLPEAESAATVGNTIGTKRYTQPAMELVDDLNPEDGTPVFNREEQVALREWIQGIDVKLDRVREETMGNGH